MRLNYPVVNNQYPVSSDHVKPYSFLECVQVLLLNAYLFDMANIRNQCTWVHSGDKDTATDKAKDLVRMAISKAALTEPLAEAAPAPQLLTEEYFAAIAARLAEASKLPLTWFGGSVLGMKLLAACALLVALLAVALACLGW